MCAQSCYWVLVQAVRAQRNLVVKAEQTSSTEGQVDVEALVKDLQTKVRTPGGLAPGRQLSGGGGKNDLALFGCSASTPTALFGVIRGR